MKSILSVVRPQDLNEVDARLDATFRDNNRFEYADNLRIATVGNSEEEIAYDQRKEKGCCGYFDEEFTCASGTKYRIGFNYGH